MQLHGFFCYGQSAIKPCAALVPAVRSQIRHGALLQKPQRVFHFHPAAFHQKECCSPLVANKLSPSVPCQITVKPGQ